MGNIVLTGMPGSVKSTVGVLLAKALGYSFIDTDLIISRKAGKPLQRILDEDGLDRFLELEEEVGSTLDCEYTVVATGGSMVLSQKAMEHLKSIGTVVYINVAFDEIKRRVTNITTRGIVFHKDETLKNVFDQRTPLYRGYSDITVDIPSENFTVEKSVEALVKRLEK